VKRLILILSAAALLFAQPPLPRPAPALNLLAPCKGRVTLVAFMVTTCPHCKTFSHDVMRGIDAGNLACTVGIVFDEDGDPAKFASEQELRFPVYKLERSKVREILGMTGEDRIIGTPQVMLIDPKGMIRAQSKPEGTPLLLQWNVIRGLIESLRRGV
jgi:peroxiredoxin